MASLSIFAFATLKIFPILIDNYGLYAPMLMCFIVCILGILFCIFILKETKGKNLNTLEEN